MAICLYFVHPNKVNFKKIEEWAIVNIGVRDTSVHGWNWIGLPSGNCIGLRLPTHETVVSYKLTFPYPMHGEFETMETFTYEDMARNRLKQGI